MTMKRVFLFGFFFAFLPFASQAAERPPAAKNHDARKSAAPPLSGKPIEPIDKSETAPRAGWSGAYFGVNAGAALSDANR
jgi:hypothetical protein